MESREVQSAQAGQAVKTSYLMLVLTMLVFGTVGLFVRGIPLPSPEIALMRSLIASLALTLFLAAAGRLKGLFLAPLKFRVFLLSGAVMAINWLLLFEAYRFTSIALATLAYYAAPSLMFIASAVFFKERLSPAQTLCFLASTLGLVLMLGVSGASPGDFRGILLALASAVLYTTVVMINKAAPQVDSIQRTYVQFIAATLVMLPVILLGGGFHLGQLTGGSWLLLLILGLVHTGLCYCLYFMSINKLKGQQVAILSYLDPLAAVLLSVVVLGEKVQPLQLLGGAIMVLAAFLNELIAMRGRRKA